MEITKLVRDSIKVQSSLKELPDGRVVALKPTKVYCPTRFTECHLASVGEDTQIVGIMAIVIDDTFYGVMSVNAMVRLVPTSMIKVMIDQVEYFEFYFEPGSTVIASTQLVKNNVLVYRIYDEIISKGKIPWYMGYEDLARIFDTAKYHANANIGGAQEVTELIVSIIARDATDRSKSYRSSLKSMADLLSRPPAFIPMRSVQYAATNTTNKIAGSYMTDGMVSALVNPADRKERIESLLLL